MQKRKHLHLPFRRKLILSFVINGACMLAALVYAIAGLTTMHRTVGDIAHSIVNKTFLSFIFNGLFSC